jgi:hypothetical protein
LSVSIIVTVYLRRFMMCRRIFYLVFVFVLSLVSTSFTDVVFGDQTVPFSLQAVGDITIDNGPRWGQDGNSNGSGLEARDIPDRRHVFLLSYDISSLKGRGPVSNVSLSNFSHDQHGEVNVYGIIEDLDLLDVESLTWNTAPGVKNDPAPELNSSVTAALDMNDLTDVLLTFSGPGETGVRFSTDTSDALADFINSDTDGIITLLVVPAAEGNQLIIRSREHSAGGTFLEGQAAPIAKIIWVSDNKGYGTEPNLAADHGFVDLLRSNGYDVVYKNEFEYIDGTQYWRTLDDDKIAELEAADLVIMSRNGDSGSYSTAADNEPNQWNAVTTPLISLSAYMSRVGKWGWLNGTSTFRAKEAMMKVVDPNHPVFAGVAIDPNGLVEATSAQYNMDWVTGVTDAGNGKILAIRPDDGLLSIVTWEAGQKYFDGSLYTAGGPRMLFIAGTGSGNNDPNYSPDGAYNLTSEGEKMFLNAMKYMLPAAPATPTHLYTFEDGTAKDEIDSADGTLVGGAEIIDGAMVTTAQDQWMEMPGDVIAMNTYDAVTIEAWYIPTAGANTSWSMLAYFGDSVDGLGSNGFFITSARGDDKSRAAISIGDIATPWASESGADGPEIDDGLLHYMASTIDGTDITLYIDGELIASTPLSAANQISGISQNYAYLAKGGYTGDPEWIGAIEQFAIYDVALSEAQIAANYAAGPIKPVEVPIVNPSFESPDLGPGNTGQWADYVDGWVINGAGWAYLEDGTWFPTPDGINILKLWNGAYIWQQIGTVSPNTDYEISIWIGRGDESSALQVELWAGGDPSLLPDKYGEIDATVGAALINGAALTPSVEVGENELMSLTLNTGDGVSDGDALWVKIENIGNSATWIDDVAVILP